MRLEGGPYAPAMGLRRYRELLSIPGVPPLLVAAFVARLPYGMFALALILLLRAQGFDYAAIGIVTAASGFSRRRRGAGARARDRPRRARRACSSPRRGWAR